MGNLYSIDHIAEGYIHKDITCNIEKPEHKHRLGTVGYILLGRGGLNMVYWLKILALSFCSGLRN